MEMRQVIKLFSFLALPPPTFTWKDGKPDLGAELELRRSGSSLGPSQ